MCRFKRHAFSPPRFSLALLTLVAGCTVGPDFSPRPAPDIQSLTPEPLKLRVAGGTGQRFVPAQDLPGEWWKLFRSPELTRLVEAGLRNNHDLRAAQAALRVARANYEAQRGGLFPVVGVGETSSRQKVATADLASPTISGDAYYSLHTGQLAISYVPDVFGGIRRQVEAASAQADVQRFALEATYLTLTTNIALAAIQEASLNGQIAETRAAVHAFKILAAGEDYAPSFSATGRDWAALRAAIGQAEQTIPLLKKQLVAQRDLLIALTGRFPDAAQKEPPSIRLLQLPKDLPLMLPSQIVAQRPDVGAAQANLHAASALVGVAIANRIPLFNITGNIGRSSSQIGNLASPAPQFLFWTIAGSVTQTIFDGFTLEQRQRAAEAGLDQAAEQYESTVVTAFQNVADVLQAIQLDGESVGKAAAATRDAKENLCLTADAFAKGRVNNSEGKRAEILRQFDDWWVHVCQADAKHFREKTMPPDPDNAPSGIDVVTSEQLYLATRLTLVTAQAAQYMDVVALFQALGGGWWNRMDVEPQVLGAATTPQAP